MSDMEKVIEKALQYVPMVDASQTRIREIQAQKIAQALTASGYGGFEVVRGADVRELVEAVQKLIDQARIVNCWADADAYSRLEETGSDYRYGQTCLLTVRCDALQRELNSLAEREPFAEARAQGAADERERLAKAVEGDATPITVPVEVEPRTWQPITIDHRALSAWLRSQKDTTHDQ